MSANPDILKKAAALEAAKLVRDGMRLGLGTGSTARFFVDAIGEKVKAGQRFVCVPTSEKTAAQAARLGIPLTTLDETPELDLTVDGADEVGPDMVLIKGGGGALLREKIVAAASARMIVIADAGKKVETLGAYALPIEVVNFGLESTRRRLERMLRDLGYAPRLTLRFGSHGQSFETDEGHRILDAELGRIPDPVALDRALSAVPGVVEHGLFIGLARGVILAGPSGIETMGSVA